MFKKLKKNLKFELRQIFEFLKKKFFCWEITYDNTNLVIPDN